MSNIAPILSAPQHGPRPLPLFLSILWSVTEQDAELRRRAFRGLKLFQTAERAQDESPPKIAARHDRALLLTHDVEAIDRHGGEPSDRNPVILVPSLINPPKVMDLTEQRSLLRFLLRQGHDAYLLDWGTPTVSERDVDLADHVSTLLLPLIERFERPPLLIGYCLGGTLAIGAASVMAQQGSPAAGVATIAAPWYFDRYDAPFREQLAQTWSQAKSGCEALGLVPMEVFQTGFWALDPARTIHKYANFGDMAPGSPAWQGFIAVEDWANEGAPLTFGSGVDLADHCYASNMTGNGNWSIDGMIVDPEKLDCATLAVVSTSDAIVPAGATPPADERLDLALGHVGMMIGSRAEDQLWRGLSDWLSRCGG